MERRGEMVTDATIFASERINLEKGAVGQLADAASLPPVRKVLATADIHVGFGIPIGCVMGMEDAIMPPAVGYDINCGMRLLRTPFEKGQIDTDKVATDIAREIPLGEGKENLKLGKASLDEVIHNGVAGIPALVRKGNHRAWEAFDPDQFARDMSRIEDRGTLAGEASAVPNQAIVKGANQIGTLGGGNHFIEIQYVQEVFDKALGREFGLSQNQIVVMIHSGSRRFGYEIADQYMNVAAGHGVNSGRGKMLSYLPTEDKKGKAYIGAMSAAANFA
jgi:tRNA-splicing ligase RtcB